MDFVWFYVTLSSGPLIWFWISLRSLLVWFCLHIFAGIDRNIYWSGETDSKVRVCDLQASQAKTSNYSPKIVLPVELILQLNWALHNLHPKSTILSAVRCRCTWGSCWRQRDMTGKTAKNMKLKCSKSDENTKSIEAPRWPEPYASQAGSCDTNKTSDRKETVCAHTHDLTSALAKV